LHTHLVIANRVQGPDGERRWTAGICIGIGWPPTPSTGPPISASLSGHWVWSGQQGTATATWELQGVPEALVRGFSKRASQIDAELDRLTAEGGGRTPRLVK
jgi:hypothetical protein